MDKPNSKDPKGRFLGENPNMREKKKPGLKEQGFTDRQLPSNPVIEPDLTAAQKTCQTPIALPQPAGEHRRLRGENPPFHPNYA